MVSEIAQVPVALIVSLTLTVLITILIGFGVRYRRRIFRRQNQNRVGVNTELNEEGEEPSICPNSFTCLVEPPPSKNGSIAVGAFESIPLEGIDELEEETLLDGNSNCGAVVPVPVDMDTSKHERRRTRSSVDISAGEFDMNRLLRLGDGQTGVVVGGVLRQKFRDVDVAIKSLKPECSHRERYIEAMCREIGILEELGSHPHIVQLFGVHRRPQTLSPYIIMERCVNGSLKLQLDYIREHAINTDAKADCIEVESRNEGDLTTTTTTTTTVYEKMDLLVWAYQIADAMEYVHSKNILHGDIAARNILFYNKKLVKVTDFGLSRRLNGDEVRTYVSGERIPWQWCPPEIMKAITITVTDTDNHSHSVIFSKQSDIWAYGVTLFEIFSFGQEPYGNEIIPAQLFKDLFEGVRLARPEFAPEGMYNLMRKCWHAEPNQRISFSEIKMELKALAYTISGEKKKDYIKM